jgi:hypothetical protein
MAEFVPEECFDPVTATTDQPSERYICTPANAPDSSAVQVTGDGFCHRWRLYSTPADEKPASRPTWRTARQ